MDDLDPDDPMTDLELEPAGVGAGLPDWLWGRSAWGARRPTWATVVAAILLLNTVSQVLYAGMLPLLPPLLPDPVPWFGMVLGAAAFAAGVGVLRGLEWGRWLAIALAISWLARSAALLESWTRTPLQPGAPSLALDILLPVAVNLIIVGLLLVRWPRRWP